MESQRRRHSLRVRCPLCTSACRTMPKHPDAQLLRCLGCGHAFSNPESISEPEQYGNAYYEEDHKRWFENPNTALFRRILEHVPMNASLVDVGCGRGDFLRFAQDVRLDLKLTGIDLSANEAPGIRFIQGDILQTEIPERFDVVVSLAVIEHIAEVKAFVAALRKLAQFSGLLIVMTLNDGSLLYSSARLGRSLGVPLAYDRLYSAHHVHHFTRSSLSGLLTGSGCIVKKHLDHNAPVKAMDLPVKNKALDSILRAGLYALWAAGRLSRRSYLQTVICAVHGL